MGDLLRQLTTEVTVSLSNVANELNVPNRLKFVTGDRYKLLLMNPSPWKHYFAAKNFANCIWTQKVEVGKVEVRGSHEPKLKLGAEV